MADYRPFYNFHSGIMIDEQCAHLHKKLRKHMKAGAPDRVAGYLKSAFETWNPADRKHHPAREDILVGIGFLMGCGWRAGFRDKNPEYSDRPGMQFRAESPDNRVWVSKFKTNFERYAVPRFYDGLMFHIKWDQKVQEKTGVSMDDEDLE